MYVYSMGIHFVCVFSSFSSLAPLYQWKIFLGTLRPFFHCSVTSTPFHCTNRPSDANTIMFKSLVHTCTFSCIRRWNQIKTLANFLSPHPLNTHWGESLRLWANKICLSSSQPAEIHYSLNVFLAATRITAFQILSFWNCSSKIGPSSHRAVCMYMQKIQHCSARGNPGRYTDGDATTPPGWTRWSC